MREKKPNILILLIDCLRHDRAVGSAGGAVIPALTELREGGTSFDTTLSTVSCTTPSVAAMLSGLYPPNNGVLSMRGYRYKKDVRPLATVLSENGYHCRAEVSGPLIPEVGLDRGFAEYNYRERSRNVFSPFGDELIDLVKGGMPEPWCLFVHVWALHRPRKILRQFKRPAFGEYMYDRSLTSIDTVIDKVVKATPMDDTIVVLTGDHGERMQEGDFYRQAYRYVSRVKSMEPHWDRFRLWRKRNMPKPIKKLFRIQGEGAYHGFHIYDYLVRVPLFLTGGPFPAGKRIKDQVRHVDLMPTLLDAVGIEDEVTASIDGRSVMPLVRDESLDPAPAYLEATGLNLGSKKNWRAGIRTDEWKYMRKTTAEDPEEELYDLAADAEEKSNLAGENAEVLEKMRAELDKVFAEAAGDLEEMSDEEVKDLDARLRALGYMD
jgi:arylsulfatase A-like enzyme